MRLFVFFSVFFFLYNHREYIEKVVKPIAKAKYKDMTKKIKKEKKNMHNSQIQLRN
jgi:predicted PurR-regulated permease PerM